MFSMCNTGLIATKYSPGIFVQNVNVCARKISMSKPIERDMFNEVQT